MKKSGISWALILVIGLLAAGGFGGWRWFGPMPVAVAYPTEGPAVRAVYATGTVEPSVMLPIAPRNAGRLMELNADEGDSVRKDQVLARLDDADLQRSVDELEARARFAKSQFDRAQTLYERKLGSLLERDQARSEWQAGEAALARARALRGFMTLSAPADGQILQRDGEIGQLIPANQPIFYFSCCAPLRIEAEVDEEDILLVQPGQRTLIHAPALPDRVLEGKVSEITPKGNPVTRSYRVRIGLEGDTPLRIGMTVEVNIVVEQREHVLLVPSTAVIDGHVWILQDGRLSRRAVVTGIKGQLNTEIQSGLRKSDHVVIRPSPDLEEGRRARITAE